MPRENKDVGCTAFVRLLPNCLDPAAAATTTRIRRAVDTASGSVSSVFASADSCGPRQQLIAGFRAGYETAASLPSSARSFASRRAEAHRDFVKHYRTKVTRMASNLTGIATSDDVRPNLADGSAGAATQAEGAVVVGDARGGIAGAVGTEAVNTSLGMRGGGKVKAGVVLISLVAGARIFAASHFFLAVSMLMFGLVATRLRPNAKAVAQDPLSPTAGGNVEREDRMEGLFIAPVPGGEAQKLNMTTGTLQYETETTHLEILTMHRPSHDARLEAMDYLHKDKFAGRKRLWEIRLRFKFKKIPGPLYVGIELNQFFKLTGASQFAFTVFKRLIFAYFGDGFYHSSGNDPEGPEEEKEPPTFALPLWGFDQVIVSKPGEEPDLHGSLEGKGWRRTDGLRAYRATLAQVAAEMDTERIYTLCFWGPSRYFDLVNWRVPGLPGGLKLSISELSGMLPFNVVLYDLEKKRGNNEANAPPETRHLRSMKNYFMRVAVWHKAHCQPPPDLAGAAAGAAAAPRGPSSPSGRQAEPSSPSGV